MTKAELEKEAEEKYSEVDREFVDCQDEGEIFNLGYLAGAEPREKRIADLEATNKKISDECHKLVDSLEKKQSENADLKSECRTCVYTDSPCVRSDYPSKDGVCSHYKNVFDENTELRLKLSALEGQTPWKDIKDKSEVIGKLTNAKEIIKGLLSLAEMDNREYEEEYKKAEQFLKEVEK